MASYDEDGVGTLNDYKDKIIDGEEEEIELMEMKRDIGGEMWCEENGEFVEKGDCGYDCPEYKPTNWKRGSGRCSYLTNGFVATGRKFLLTRDGLKEIRLGE